MTFKKKIADSIGATMEYGVFCGFGAIMGTFYFYAYPTMQRDSGPLTYSTIEDELRNGGKRSETLAGISGVIAGIMAEGALYYHVGKDHPWVFAFPVATNVLSLIYEYCREE